MHIHRAASGTAWPGVPFDGWRLWDAGVAWPELEPERGKFDFTLLDRYARIATEHRVRILLTLGLTPAWASARPDEPSGYANGNAAEPRSIIDWKDYIRAVATRYKGVIHDYEIWNEPNAKASFTGTTEKMLELASSAYQVLKDVDPTITVISPSATADTGVKWLEDFGKIGGCEYADVVGYHFYVTPAAPEAMAPLIQKVQDVTRGSGCTHKPLWNTESGWAKPKRFTTTEEAAGYLMRTYLLNWLMGVQRCYWYAWDNHNWSTLDLTSSLDGRATDAGAAYGVIHQWLLGATLRSCSRDHAGLWICYLDRERASSYLIWSDQGAQSVTLPPDWHVLNVINWKTKTIKLTSPLIVGSTPMLLISK